MSVNVWVSELLSNLTHRILITILHVPTPRVLSRHEVYVSVSTYGTAADDGAAAEGLRVQSKNKRGARRRRERRIVHQAEEAACSIGSTICVYQAAAGCEERAEDGAPIPTSSQRKVCDSDAPPQRRRRRMRRGFANLGLTCGTAGTHLLQGSHMDPTVPAVPPFLCFADICVSHTRWRDARYICRHGRRGRRARPPPAVTVGASGRRRGQVGHHHGGFARGPPHPGHRLRGPSMAPVGTRRGRGWRATASEVPAACDLHSHQKPIHADANYIFF